MSRSRPAPLGRLVTGDEYYAPVGRMNYDGDRVQCHLCGRWLKMVGGTHLLSAHDLTLDQYREMFRLHNNVSTAAPRTSDRKRSMMLAQSSSGQRDPSVLVRASAPTVGSWRSVAALHPELLSHWHPTRNPGLDPAVVGQHSTRKVWWRCPSCDHEWQASPHQRTGSGQGCPACGGRRSMAATIARNRSRQTPPERTLARLRPDLLVEWHPTKNRRIDPLSIAAGSGKLVWWRCSNVGCANEWTAAIADRSKRSSFGCPACAQRHAGQRRATANRAESLGALHPQLLDEWHPTKNPGLDPYALKPGSGKRVWWRCAYCGDEWQAPPQSRSRSPRGGCPPCAASIARSSR